MVYVSRCHMNLSQCRLLDYAKIHIFLDIFLNIYIYMMYNILSTYARGI